MISTRTHDTETRGTIRSRTTESEAPTCDADPNPAPRKRRRIESDWTDAQQHTRPQFDDLPNEILALVLSNVERPMRPVVPFVCRRWRDVFAERPRPSAENPLSSRQRHEPAKYCTALAAVGYISVLAWARANGCP
ncbi:F-box incomplete domain containing protein [Pandoravirus neocaledonia]|uniref:F-box incomplete domain containing protein n=1 Tax=Pandoravirus neocaledonia TaxID=2107708 RepID=A0A2U7UC68_9VIRU|nr:F-box incomplete domain containing protein [Pandoravirus neocaledonia]AVK76058.1 F-box incomplete domain containing protein [Pandoravirus neocaledonia]